VERVRREGEEGGGRGSSEKEGREASSQEQHVHTFFTTYKARTILCSYGQLSPNPFGVVVKGVDSGADGVEGRGEHA
jgi:hypothetical protein